MASNVPTLEPDDAVNIAEPTASSNFEAQVQAKMPAAKKTVAAYSPIEQLGAYQPFQFGQLPIVGPAYNKAIDLARAALGQGAGATTGDRYSDIQAERAAIENARYAAAPKTYSVMSGVPGAASMIYPPMGIEEKAAALTENAPSLIKSVTPYLGRMTESGLTSAASSEALPGETPKETAQRLGTTFGVGAAATPVASAITGGVKMAKNVGSKLYGLFDPESVMAKKIVAGAATQPSIVPSERQLTVEEYLDALDRGDKNVSLADVQGAKPTILKAEGQIENDPNALALNSVINKRIANNPSIIASQIDDAAGKPIDIVAAREAADKAYRSSAAPAYNAAFNSKGADAVWNPYFNTVINTKEGQAAIDFANNERIKDNDLTPSPFAKDPQTGLYVLRSPTGQVGPEQPPDLKYWDYVKRGLNSVWRGQKSDPKEADTAASTASMMNQFTNILKNQFPLYDKATSTAQRYIKADNAFDAGSDFFGLITKPKGNAEDIGNQMNYLTNSPKNGGYSDQEKGNFKTGLLSFIKENPDAAASAFKGMDSATENRMRAALGDDAFDDVNNAFKMARVRELTGTLGLSAKNKMSTGQLLATSAAGSAAGLGAVQAAGSVLSKVPEIASHVTDPYAVGMTLAAAGLAIPIAGGAMAVRGLANQRAAAMLRMAVDPNPQVQQKLRDALNSDDLNKKIFSNLESRLTNYVATHPAMNPTTPSDTNRASGGRVGHKSGGKVGGMTAEALLRDLKRRRVMLASKTEHMLSLPDDAVVQALDAAKR